MPSFSIEGNIVNIEGKEIYYGEIRVVNGKIASLQKLTPKVEFSAGVKFILPGFIDSHVHIESSMLIPSEFAKLAVVHGTVATVSDPHEIANICGIDGVDFMIDNGNTVPFKFHFGAPSCVPATVYETAGAALNAEAVDALLQRPEISYLSEVMNFPGVLNGDEEVMRKIASAKKHNKPVDGHAPGLMGGLVKKYIDAGITTDHECFTKEEALDKLKYGMNILIREGSAAKNFEALIDLLQDYPQRMMFCSDDKHPDSLVQGHINHLCARAVAKGIDIFKVLQAACVNPVNHYKMNVGLLKEGDTADFIVLEDLLQFKVLQTYINGELVAENGHSYIKIVPSAIINSFDCNPIEKDNLTILRTSGQFIDVIESFDGQLITNKFKLDVKLLAGGKENELVSKPAIDILKIIVVNRYKPSKVAIAFIKNIGLKRGAIASSIAHDSHNIVAVGCDDESLVKAVNLIIKEKGGISAVNKDHKMVLSLPVAGLMSNEDGYKVATAYTAIDKMVKEELGSGLSAPFMTLSFMALLVIPHLKLSDLGLFDGDGFNLV